MNAPLWVWLPVTVLVILAARADVRTRRIPNALIGPALALGLVSHLALGGWAGGRDALLGMAVAGALLLPGHLFGWMGAGDVKLMAAVGAWLAWPLALVAALAALVAGGVMAVVLALRRGVLARALVGAAALGAWALCRPARGSSPPPVSTGVRFPFAVAAAAGAIFSLMVRW